jgi:cytochrome c556
MILRNVTLTNMALRKTALAAALALSCGFSMLAYAHSGATGIVKERMDFFKQNKDDLKAIKTHFRNGDLDTIVPLATQIRDWAEKMPAYFPAGSDGKPASPQIWLDFSGFERAANANYQAANQLVIAAKAGDSKAAINAFKATAATCKSCHKSYRLD